MTSGEGYLGDARSMLADGELSYASTLFRMALVRLDPGAMPEEMAAALVGLGRISHARGDAARAALYAQEALRHDPNCREAKQLLADLSSPNERPSPHDAWRREAELPP